MADRILKEDDNKDVESGKPVQLEEEQDREPEQPASSPPGQPDR